MALDIKQYLHERDQMATNGTTDPAPFVTLSRETGCHSRIIAQMLQKEIQKMTGLKWRIISKETIMEAAKEMQLNLQQVENVLNATEKGHLEEILMAFGEKHYKSYQKVRSTLKKLITTFAHEGRCIIIGRAGAAITAGFRNGAHIRLVAPLAWRTQSIANQQGITLTQAAAFVAETDVRRKKLFHDLCGKELDPTHFDLVINNEQVSDEAACGLIIRWMQLKHLIE